MRELKIARSYHELLRRLGVQAPGEVNLSTPVHMGATVDDLSHLVAPVQVSVVSIGAFTTAAVADYSGIEIQARAGGIWIEHMSNAQNNNLAFWVANAQAAGTLVAVLVPECVFGPQPLSIISTYRTNALPAGDPGFIRGNDEWWGLPFFIQPGQFFYVVRDAVNQTCNQSITWREVPSGASVD